jgi:lantibiotic modifying enzyme
VVARLARQIRAGARRETDGRIVWSHTAYLERRLAGTREGRPDGYWDLYSGIPGIALFFAACDRTGLEDGRAFALEILAPIRTQARAAIHGEDIGRLGRLGIGGFVGLGELLDEPDLREEAHALGALLTPAKVLVDEHLDVVYGSAGAVLALLALDLVAPHPNAAGSTPLELAQLCGRHLLSRQSSDPTRPRTWNTLPGRPPRLGLAHGAAGIALAFARLFRRTGSVEWWQAARQGLDFERPRLSARPGSSPWAASSEASGWCSGAAGIALALLGCAEAAPDDAERAEISRLARAALTAVRSAPAGALDHLCCGNLGRAEALAHACQQTGDGEALRSAGALADRVVESAVERGHFRGDYRGRLDSSLFRGAAGVGYALLRLLAPETLPCPLVLE